MIEPVRNSGTKAPVADGRLDNVGGGTRVFGCGNSALAGFTLFVLFVAEC